MRSLSRIFVTTLAALLLLPATVGAQVIIEPERPIRAQAVGGRSMLSRSSMACRPTST